MRATAFEPPPPTPTTLIRVPNRNFVFNQEFQIFAHAASSFQRVPCLVRGHAPLRLVTFAACETCLAHMLARRSRTLRFHSLFSFSRPEYMPGRRLSSTRVDRAPPANLPRRLAARCAPGNSECVRQCRTCRKERAAAGQNNAFEQRLLHTGTANFLVARSRAIPPRVPPEFR